MATISRRSRRRTANNHARRTPESDSAAGILHLGSRAGKSVIRPPVGTSTEELLSQIWPASSRLGGVCGIEATYCFDRPFGRHLRPRDTWAARVFRQIGRAAGANQTGGVT